MVILSLVVSLLTKADHQTLNTTIMENWNSQRMQDLRQAFLNGEKAPRL